MNSLDTAGVKRYTECQKHGRQPLTETNGDWFTNEACLECVIDWYQRGLAEKLKEQIEGGANWVCDDETEDDHHWHVVRLRV